MSSISAWIEREEQSFSGIESGRYELQPGPVNTIGTIRQVFKDIKELAGSKSVQPELTVNGMPPEGLGTYSAKLMTETQGGSIDMETSEPEVIIITAEANTRGAEMALENNAWDYIVKPFSKNEIRLNVERSLEFRSSRKALSTPENILNRADIVGQSPALVSCLATAGQCAKSDVNVLITGGTGTGKELFANVIHENSRRSGNRFWRYL